VKGITRAPSAVYLPCARLVWSALLFARTTSESAAQVSVGVLAECKMLAVI